MAILILGGRAMEGMMLVICERLAGQEETNTSRLHVLLEQSRE